MNTVTLSIPTLGIKTRAWQFGNPSGAPLILVHGFRGDHHGLEEIAREIAVKLPTVRTIVPDLPGFGETPPVPAREHALELYGEWLRAFATQVAPDGCAILGHSFGSLVVADAVAGGLDAHCAILINPISAPALKGPHALLTQLAIGYYRAAALLPETAARRLLSNPLIVRAMSEVMTKTRDTQLRSWIHQQHAHHFSSFSDPETLLAAFRASVSHTVTDFAAAFQLPTLLIAGDRDDIMPLEKQLGLHYRIPGSLLRALPGVGHLVHYEGVSDAVAFITDFLAAEGGAGSDAADSGEVVV